MLINYLLLFHLILFNGNITSGDKENPPVNAWIEIKGEVDNLYVTAKLRNIGNKLLTLDYVLNTVKKGRSGNSNTVQKGKCISNVHEMVSLSETRMNLSQSDELIISLMVYRDSKLIAQDSVVFHPDNH